MLLTHFVACHVIHVTVFIALAPRRFLAADLDYMGANRPCPRESASGEQPRRSTQTENTHTNTNSINGLILFSALADSDECF